METSEIEKADNDTVQKTQKTHFDRHNLYPVISFCDMLLLFWRIEEFQWKFLLTFEKHENCHDSAD